METIEKFLVVETEKGKRNLYNDRRRATLGAVIHYFSAINSLKPDKWADWEICWQLFHDLNLEPDQRKFGLYEDKKVSASAEHLIDRDGRDIILAPPGSRTWHAGSSIMNNMKGCNDFTIGLEVVAAPYMAREKNGQYNKELLLLYGYTQAQYEAVAEIIFVAMKYYGFKTNWVQGHDTVRRAWNIVAPAGKKASKKYDPGIMWNWTLLRSLIHNKYQYDLDGG